MVQGIGTDILEISRFDESLKRRGQSFLDRLFTKEEQEYCHSFNDSTSHFAGRFACKEAIAKALGSGFGDKLAFLDLNILNNDLGKPSVYFSDTSKELWQDPQMLISISHCQQFVVAMAVWI